MDKIFYDIQRGNVNTYGFQITELGLSCTPATERLIVRNIPCAGGKDEEKKRIRRVQLHVVDTMCYGCVSEVQ